MFVGHFAVAFAAKRVTPKTSLGTLVLGAQFLDLIWPPLVLLGVERVRIEPGATRITPLAFDSYPISHSLVMAVAWSALIGGIYFWRKRTCAGAAVLGLAVFSHWVLDWITHRPDLQLIPGRPARAGLGLWDHPVAAIAIESAMFAGAVVSYSLQTRARDAVGRWGWISFATFLSLVYAANVTGPPPPNASVVAWMALALWLLVPWAAWFDRHRQATATA